MYSKDRGSKGSVTREDALTERNSPFRRTQLYSSALPPRVQSITVRNADLNGDASQLRQAWETWLFKEGIIDRSISEQGCESGVFGRESSTRLVFAGKDLLAGKTLRGYGLSSGSTVHVLGRLRGGAQLGKVVKGRSQVKTPNY